MNDKEYLKTGFDSMGVETDEKAIDRFLDFKEILLEWNEKINLTTITEKEEIFIKHYFDSAACLRDGYIKTGMKVIDVGTGAGFPGVPLKILREDIDLTLLDSLNKRISYLDDVLSRLNIKNVELVHARAEEGGANVKYREKFDIVLSRAVAAMNVLVEYCLPYVAVGGFFLCQKGPNCEEELKDAEKAIALLGGEIKEVKLYKLPYRDITHSIIIIQKIKSTPTKYPRKPGKPSSDPIK